MQTDELINMMGGNPPDPRHVYLGQVRMILALTLCVAVAVVGLTIGFRADFANLFADPETFFKYGFATVMLVASGLAWWRHGQPGRTASGPLMFISLFMGWLLIMCVRSYYTKPFEVLKTAVMESEGIRCAGIIFGLAICILPVLMRLNRRLAPPDAATHGYLSALFASSIGLFAFALHCPHDEPLYVAVWYVGSLIASTVIAGRFAARRASW